MIIESNDIVRCMVTGKSDNEKCSDCGSDMYKVKSLENKPGFTAGSMALVCLDCVSKTINIYD